jgi:hypothetical protein
MLNKPAPMSSAKAGSSGMMYREWMVLVRIENTK